MSIEHALSEVEIRVLGCLLEKQATTPEYYPLTLNSLTAACNQKSNRDPVMQIDDSTVLRVLADLEVKSLCGEHRTAGSRVIKYGHNLGHIGDFSVQERALLTVLMLRGPQTVGELRGRTGRYCEFTDLTQVESILESLAARESGALVEKLPRQTGRKECRYGQLLGGPYEFGADAGGEPVDRVAVRVQAENERIATIEEKVALLESEIAAIKTQFDSFRKQFE